MAYVNLNFVPGEILTAAKMNLLAANDTSFHDGTGIDDGSIQPEKLADSLTSYKTTEVDTGKKWHDERPIYRTVIRGRINIAANANIFYNHGITGLTDAFEVVSARGSIVMGGSMGNSSGKSLIPHVEDNHRLGISLITKTQLRFIATYPWGSSEFVLIMDYVK